MNEQKPPGLLAQLGTVALVTAPFWLAVLLTSARAGGHRGRSRG